MSPERKKSLLTQIKEALGIGPEGGLPPKPWHVESGMEGAFTGADISQDIEDHPILLSGTKIKADTRSTVTLQPNIILRSYAEGERDTAGGGNIVHERTYASLIGGPVKKKRIVSGLGFTGHSEASVGSKPQPPEE